MKTPAKMGVRARIKVLEQDRNRAVMEANNGTIVVAALAKKLGLFTRDSIREVVDEYMRDITDQLKADKEARKKAQLEGSTQVIDQFIDPALFSNDPVIMGKVAEFCD